MTYLQALRATCFGVVLLLTSGAALAESVQDPFLDGMRGRWRVDGTLNGHAVKHEFKADWIIQYEYLRFRDVSEEETSDGKEEFEALVHIGYDPVKSQYVCVWLENGGVAEPEAIVSETARVGDTLPFVFKGPQGLVHRTIAYDKSTNTWTITIAKEVDGTLQPVANLTLKKR